MYIVCIPPPPRGGDIKAFGKSLQRRRRKEKKEKKRKGKREKKEKKGKKGREEREEIKWEGRKGRVRREGKREEKGEGKKEIEKKKRKGRKGFSKGRGREEKKVKGREENFFLHNFIYIISINVVIFLQKKLLLKILQSSVLSFSPPQKKREKYMGVFLNLKMETWKVFQRIWNNIHRNKTRGKNNFKHPCAFSKRNNLSLSVLYFSME